MAEKKGQPGIQFDQEQKHNQTSEHSGRGQQQSGQLHARVQKAGPVSVQRRHISPPAALFGGWGILSY